MVKTITIEDETHKGLKIEATRQGTDIKDLTERICSDYLKGLAEGGRT